MASSWPPGTSRASSARASAMSMLSPPSSRWSPTATRSSAELAAALPRGDQRQVGGAAADVDHEHERHARATRVAPVALVRRRARRRTRPAAPRAARPSAGPATRAASSVSSRATSSNDAGTVSTTSCAASGSGSARVPGVAQVRRGRAPTPRPARSCATSSAAAPRQDRGRAIDAAVAEPRLRRRDEPARHARALLARELADAEVAARRPGQGEAPGRHVVRAGEVEERRQRRPRRDLARRDELRHVEDPDRRGPALRVDVGARRVGRAEVDADEVAGGHRAAQPARGR